MEFADQNHCWSSQGTNNVRPAVTASFKALQEQGKVQKKLRFTIISTTNGRTFSNQHDSQKNNQPCPLMSHFEIKGSSMLSRINPCALTSENHESKQNKELLSFKQIENSLLPISHLQDSSKILKLTAQSTQLTGRKHYSNSKGPQRKQSSSGQGNDASSSASGQILHGSKESDLLARTLRIKRREQAMLSDSDPSYSTKKQNPDRNVLSNITHHFFRHCMHLSMQDTVEQCIQKYELPYTLSEFYLELDERQTHYRAYIGQPHLFRLLKGSHAFTKLIRVLLSQFLRNNSVLLIMHANKLNNQSKLIHYSGRRVLQRLILNEMAGKLNNDE